MIKKPIEVEQFQTKQEATTNEGRISKASSSSAPWLRLKDPRIVRVSRAFGGKDRHSKVCTVRGLRDRRVRLSVPTAIQLYDLQDRLGLNQPSKVVDWLLNAAKHEIDELPPLQMPPGNFGLNPNEVDPSRPKVNNNGIEFEDPNGLSRLNFLGSDSLSKPNFKEVIERESQKENEGERGHGGQSSPHSSLFPRSNQSSLLGFQGSSNYHWEPPNISLSYLGNHGLTPQSEDVHNFMPSSLSLPSGSQVLVCPNGTTQPYFPQLNHIHMLSSPNSQTLLSNSLTVPPLYTLSQPMRPFSLSMTPMLVHSQQQRQSATKK